MHQPDEDQCSPVAVGLRAARRCGMGVVVGVASRRVGVQVQVVAVFLRAVEV
jgi:hypothetical protein